MSLILKIEIKGVYQLYISRIKCKSIKIVKLYQHLDIFAVPTAPRLHNTNNKNGFAKMRNIIKMCYYVHNIQDE